jgi:hypothetical protein
MGLPGPAGRDGVNGRDGIGFKHVAGVGIWSGYPGSAAKPVLSSGTTFPADGFAYVLATGTCAYAPAGSTLRFALDRVSGRFDSSTEDTHADVSSTIGQASFNVARLFPVTAGSAMFYLNTFMANGPASSSPLMYSCNSNMTVFFTANTLP